MEEALERMVGKGLVAVNLIDAVKSGRPFRRKDRGDKWIDVESIGGDMFAFEDGARLQWQKSWLLAEDYEIREPEVRITRADFWPAVHAAANNNGVRLGEELRLNFQGIEELAKRLGLEP